MDEGRLIEDVDGRLVPAGSSPARDSHVVCREPLAEAVQSFVSDWNRRHEPDNGRFAANQQRTQLTQIRATEWISERTRSIDHTSVGITERSLREMFRRTPEGQLRSLTIDLRTADMLLTAIGRNDLFPHEGVDGGDQRLRPQRRGTRACCTGSLTGVVATPAI